LSLVTRCPQCRTLFRVLAEQLQARGGQVRCGRCMHAFNGFQSLAVEHPGALPDPASLKAVAPAAVTDGPSFLSDTGEGAGTGDIAAAGRSLRRHRVSAAACFLLVLLLVGQLIYLFRGELAARSVFLKTVLTSTCRIAGCTVSLPQRPDLVKIEASDVNMIDPGRPPLIQLTATLRNYADHDVAYPALDLVLTNATEHALARRIFLPEEYLDETRDPQAAMPPRGEITVALDLDTGNLNAAGFRLDLLAAR
jgi:predicted Zn finger-like uncharacterized protein